MKLKTSSIGRMRYEPCEQCLSNPVWVHCDLSLSSPFLTDSQGEVRLIPSDFATCLCRIFTHDKKKDGKC